MIKLNTSIEPKLPPALRTSKLHKSVTQSLRHNLSVLLDAVYTSACELGHSRDRTTASIAYCQSLIHSLKFKTSKDVEDGFLYDRDSHTLICDRSYKDIGIDYPAGIRLPLELIEMITPCTLLRDLEKDFGQSYDAVLLDFTNKFFSKKTDRSVNWSQVTDLAKDAFMHHIDPTLKETTQYMLYIAKWFGDSKPSYIPEDISRQISDILEIQQGVVQNIYENADDYLEAQYINDDIERVILTKGFADRLKQHFRQELRHNDAPSARILAQEIIPQAIRSINLFDLDDSWTFETAYLTIKEALTNTQLHSNIISDRDIGLFVTSSKNGDVEFVLSYGEDSKVVNAQAAWWCLVLS